MNKLALAALAALASTALGGCATVINGTSQDYDIMSEPSGAMATLTNGQSCTTPCKVNLKRRNDLRIDLARKGYKPAYVLVQSRTGGAAVGNILLGGLIGGVVDGANGASNHLYPNPLNVHLASEGSSAEAALFDKKGKEISTLAVHNAAVSKDVAKTIGNEAAGLPAADGVAVAATAVTTQAATSEEVPLAAPAAADPAPAS